jgi:hypothetical protein
MRAAFGAVGGALAIGALLVSYNLGARNAFTGQMAVPTTQMVVGPDGIARPYLVQAGQTSLGQAMPAQPYGWSPYSATTPGAVAPLGYAAYPAYQQAAYPAYPAQRQYVTERAVTQPVRRVSTQRVSREVEPRRSWQKSAMLIGGSAGAGAGLGALMGGKKGALAGAAIGGGAAAIYDQVKRH